MTVIIGIDPGSRRTGFGVIDASGGQVRYVTSGIFVCQKASCLHD